MQVVHGQKNGCPPRCDLEAARTLNDALLGLICGGGVKSAHDCSEGGLALCLAECCVSQQPLRETPRLIGASVDLSVLSEAAATLSEPAAPSAAAAVVRLDALLFGETQNRVIVTAHPLHIAKILERAKRLGIPARQVGRVGGDQLTVKTETGEWSWPVSALHDAWWNSLARAMA